MKFRRTLRRREVEARLRVMFGEGSFDDACIGWRNPFDHMPEGGWQGPLDPDAKRLLGRSMAQETRSGGEASPGGARQVDLFGS